MIYPINWEKTQGCAELRDYGYIFLQTNCIGSQWCIVQAPNIQQRIKNMKCKLLLQRQGRGAEQIPSKYLMCIVVLHFTIMLNFPLQDFAFYTDGYFMEFAKDIARPELSMDMNLIWFVLVVPNAWAKTFFFYFPDCASSCPFRIISILYISHLVCSSDLLSDSRFSTLSPFWVGNASSTSS